jgi:hypothetical protein
MARSGSRRRGGRRVRSFGAIRKLEFGWNWRIWLRIGTFRFQFALRAFAVPSNLDCYRRQAHI